MSNDETKINSMEENYRDLQALIECLNLDFDKFRQKKVKAAGQRARNNLLNTKKLCDKLRKQILEEIKGIPVKHRISDDEKSEEDIKTEDELIEIDPVGDKVIEELPKGANGPAPVQVVKPDGEVKDKPKRKRKANKKKDEDN